MPGYELVRFVNISETEKSELKCSICHDIFNCPVVTQCCLQTFCEDCINDWLTSNNTCPYDRKTLTINEMSRPPRAFINMLGKLKICCDFKEKGCQQILFLEDLTQHTVNCRYNPENQIKKCKNCLCEYPAKSSHDCIEALLELNKKANEEIKAQNMREQTHLNKICEFESEKKNFLKTIQDLSQNNIASSSQITDQEILDRARKYLRNPDIIPNNMDQDKKGKVLSIVRDQLKEFNSLYIICESIADKLNAEFGCNWICLATHQKPIKSYFRFEPGHFLNLKFGELNMKIFKTESEIVNRAKEQMLNPDVIQNNMDQDKKGKVLSIVCEQLEECNSFDICESITDKLEEEFGYIWNCFVSHQKPMIGHYRYEPDHLLKLKFGELNMIIFKTISFNYPEMKQRLRNGKIKREIQILETDMKKNMISKVKKYIFEAIEKCNTLKGVSSVLQTQMEKSYPKYWQCLCYAHFGTFGIQYAPKTYINFKIENLDITLFKTND